MFRPAWPRVSHPDEPAPQAGPYALRKPTGEVVDSVPVHRLKPVPPSCLTQLRGLLILTRLIASFGACTRSCLVPEYRSAVSIDACPSSSWICSIFPRRPGTTSRRCGEGHEERFRGVRFPPHTLAGSARRSSRPSVHPRRGRRESPGEYVPFRNFGGRGPNPSRLASFLRGPPSGVKLSAATAHLAPPGPNMNKARCPLHAAIPDVISGRRGNSRNIEPANQTPPGAAHSFLR
jgi:hypothetical protein